MIQLSVELLETLRMTVKVALQHLRTVESMRGVASDPRAEAPRQGGDVSV